MTKLDSILKSRDITLPTKVHIVKTMVEHWRTDAFKLWCWRTLLRAPWPAKRSNQSILRSVLNIHCKDWCWSWSSNTSATWCKEPTHWKWPWCWERLKAVPGASMRSSARGKGHEEGGSAYAKVGSSLRRHPVPKHLPPKPESAYFTALCSHLNLWLYGGLSPTTSVR